MIFPLCVMICLPVVFAHADKGIANVDTECIVRPDLVLSEPFGLPSAMGPRRELGRTLGPNVAQGRRQLLRANLLK